MKTVSVVLGFLLVSAAALPAAASTPARSDAVARDAIVQEGTTGSAQPKLICRRQETTGSRVGGEKICLTREQWRRVHSGRSVLTERERVR